MLNFDEFKEYAREHLADMLPDGYKNAKITVNEVKKNNGKVLTGLSVLPNDQDVAPNIYLDGFYMKYEQGTDLKTIMGEMADICMSHLHPSQEIRNIGQQFRDISFVRDKIIMTVVNKKMNTELLGEVPHTNREDLALIYKVLLNSDSDTTATITIRNEHLNMWGVTKDEIHDLAFKNTREILPVTVQSMNEVMREIFSKDGMPQEMLDVLLTDMPAEQQMYVISNQSKINGAASIFYEDVLSDLANRVDSDLYVLPSSIHECIAISTNMGTPEDLASMVTDINAGHVNKEEQLSDHVYRFDKAARTLKLADVRLEELGLDQENDIVRPMRRGR